MTPSGFLSTKELLFARNRDSWWGLLVYSLKMGLINETRLSCRCLKWCIILSTFTHGPPAFLRVLRSHFRFSFISKLVSSTSNQFGISDRISPVSRGWLCSGSTDTTRGSPMNWKLEWDSGSTETFIKFSINGLFTVVFFSSSIPIRTTTDSKEKF